MPDAALAVLSQVPIVAAAFTAGGALLGALATQWVTSRREAKQWKRNLAQEKVQWERERQERQEQWDREDAARWERERYSAYSEILVAIDRWIDVGRRVKPYPPIGHNYISEGGVEQLKGALAEVRKAEAAINLLAPESIRGKVRTIAANASFFPLKYGPTSRLLDDEPTQDSDEKFDYIITKHRDLRDAIRQDLGIEPDREQG